LPTFIVVIGFLGLCLCAILFFLARDKSMRMPAIKESALNREVDLGKYMPTVHPDIYVEAGLPDHPFRLVKNGIFCGVCLITNPFKHIEGSTLVHTHNCTVIRKEWKIMICKDAVQAEYFISLGKAHYRKR
jgi:hypothetical protein